MGREMTNAQMTVGTAYQPTVVTGGYIGSLDCEMEDARACERTSSDR